MDAIESEYETKTSMNKPIKAALLSALVFPGLGHFYLKKHIIGSFILGISFLPLYVLVTNAIRQAQSIVDKILSGETGSDIASITALVADQSANGEAQLMNFALIVLGLVWFIALVDAYRQGRLLENTPH